MSLGPNASRIGTPFSSYSENFQPGLKFFLSSTLQLIFFNFNFLAISLSFFVIISYSSSELNIGTKTT